MTDLEDKATAARDVIRAGEAAGQLYRLESESLEPAENVGDAQFPQFGDFGDVTAVDANHDDLGPRWLEVPGGLARELVDLDVSAGDVFAIRDAEKSQDGAWTFSVEHLSNGQQNLSEAADSGE